MKSATRLTSNGRLLLAESVVANDQGARRINDAVKEGLARCRNGGSPLVSLTLYLDDLRADGSWRLADVAKIESAIRHILARVVRPATD